MCNLDGDLDVLGRLESLVTKSLIREHEGGGGEPRFSMLETIREYAAEQLEKSGEAAVLRRRHADYFLRLAEDAEPGVMGAEQRVWLERLEAENDNLRAALTWGQDETNPFYSLRLAGALRLFWHLHNQWAEGRRWLEQALAADGDTSALVEAKALNAAGHLACNQGDFERGSVLHEQALALSRPLDDPWSLAWSLGRLGHVRRMQGRYDEAAALLDEALTLFRDLGITWYTGWALNNLGCVYQDRGDLERAGALFEEALPLFRASGEVQGLGGQLAGLGDIAVARGEYQRATALYKECLAVARRANFKQRMALVLQSLGRLAQIIGDQVAAVAYYREGLTVLRETGDRQAIAASFEGLAASASSTEQPDSAWRTQRAVRLLSAATTLRLALGSPPPPTERIAHERALTAFRANLGEELFEAAWAEGRAMTLEQAVAFALEETA